MTKIITARFFKLKGVTRKNFIIKWTKNQVRDDAYFLIKKCSENRNDLSFMLHQYPQPKHKNP